MGDPAQARQFRQSRNLPFPLLSDTSQRVYRQFGLGAVSPMQELASGSMASLFGQASKGNFGGIPVGDVSQLGGTFLIDQQGIARFVHRDRSTNDFADVNAILKVIGTLAQ